MPHRKPLPLPYFDSLDAMLANEVIYKPSLTGAFLKDYELAKTFLFSYQGSQDTFNAYRREIERFLQWCQLIANKPLKQIKREEFEAYLKFCQKPPQSWIGLKKEARFKTIDGQRQPNPKWRPFVASLTKAEVKSGKTPNKKKYQLSDKAFSVLFAVIGSFYHFLIQENYTMVNPTQLIRQKNKYLKKTTIRPKIRRLSDLQWGYVLETAELAATDNPQKYERTLFVLNALYGMYLRISELVVTKRWTPTMGDFERDPDGYWWFNTVGKGNKERKITVSDAMLRALKRYRKFLKLSALPSVGEKTALISKSRDSTPIESARYIRALVQDMFDQAVERLRKDNQFEEANHLETATVHWLRHTGISDDVKIRPREHVRDDAGHSSGSITDKYIDVELRERHASGKKKNIKPECMLDT